MKITDIQQYKNSIINIILFIIGVVCAFQIYKKQIEPIEGLKNSIELEKKKNVVFSSIINLSGEWGRYREYVNVKDISAFIKAVSELANQERIKISNLRPDNSQDRVVYYVPSFSLSVTADSYHALGAFIAKLESHPYILMVESFNMKKNVAGPKDNRAASSISADLSIVTILIK